MVFKVGSDFAVHTDYVVHTKVDTDSNTGFVGKAQVGSALAPIHPDPTHCSSSNMCLLSSPSEVVMLYNTSHHSLLTYKIYKKVWLGYLQSSTSIDSPHHDAL